MNRYRRKVNMYGINYDNVLGMTIQLMKDSCKYDSYEDLKFSRSEIREISAWLTSPIYPRLFHMYDYDSDNPETEYDYFGVFTNVEAADNNICVLECTFECNAPYAFSSEQHFSINNGEGVVSNLSDEYEDYVYPKIIITPTSQELESYSISLINESDDNRYITINNMKPQDTVTIDCQKLTIKNQSGSLISFEDLNIDVMDYIYWFRLLHGDNNIRITGDADVEFIFRYPVKVGAF